ncbi:glycosyltransferase family 4 protein, partial [Desulfonauticus submarinus]
KFLEKIELRLYKSANRVVSVTDSFKQNLIKRGINAEKIEVIYNGANLELFYPRHKDTDLVNRLGLQNKFVVGYIGTHGMAHGLDFILKSIKNIEQEFHFLFIGDGAEKENLLKLKDKLGLKNVTFLNPIKKEDVPKYLSVCDVSLVPLKKSNTFKTVIPSKIFESSAMQIPILLGVEGEAKLIIEKYKAGVCFEPENKDDFLKSLHIIKEKYSLFLEGCRQLALNFDRKKLALKMLNILKEVANE